MKRSLLFLFFSLAILSCGKEYGETAENYIKLPDAINFFSNEFKEATSIAFKNDMDETKVLIVNSVYRVVSVDISDKKRYLENIDITLHHEDYPHYPILLHGTGLFHQNSDLVTPLLNTYFMYSNENYSIIGSLNINDEIFQSNMSFYEEITLNNELFKNVYSIIKEENDAYSKFYFSQKEGVVGFSDENNDLWVYDKIIE